MLCILIKFLLMSSADYITLIQVKSVNRRHIAKCLWTFSKINRTIKSQIEIRFGCQEESEDLMSIHTSSSSVVVFCDFSPIPFSSSNTVSLINHIWIRRSFISKCKETNQTRVTRCNVEWQVQTIPSSLPPARSISDRDNWIMIFCATRCHLPSNETSFTDSIRVNDRVEMIVIYAV